MSVASEHVAFFRTAWASRFVDTCVIKRATGSTFNESTGQTEPTYTTQYTGVCLVRSRNQSDADFGAQLAEVRGYRVFIPYTETATEPGDLVDVTSTFDGRLDGNQLVVRNVRGDTYNTVRVVECEENQSD